MKKWNLLLVLVLALSLMVGAVGCSDDDDDDTTGPTETVEDQLVGTWLSTGDNVATLLQGEPFNLDSIEVTFAENNTVTLRQHVTDGAWTTYTGTWGVTESENSEIHAFTGSYTSPVSFTQDGIIQVMTDVNPDEMKLEAVQTTPDIGAAVPTVEGGFGATAIGDINVQVYVRQ